jgi:hypothetical protein
LLRLDPFFYLARSWQRGGHAPFFGGLAPNGFTNR